MMQSDFQKAPLEVSFLLASLGNVWLWFLFPTF